MKFASTTSALFIAGLLAVTAAAPALAQTPPAPTPGSPAIPPAMMQMMPPQMMQMMQRMHSGALARTALLGGSLMAPAGASQNVEGHIAFLRAELKITEAQQMAWDRFADALRTNAKDLAGAPNTMMGAMDKKMSPAARLEQQEKLLTLHLEALKRSRAALDGLNAVLNDEQKKQLDELI